MMKILISVSIEFIIEFSPIRGKFRQGFFFLKNYPEEPAYVQQVQVPRANLIWNNTLQIFNTPEH